MGAFLERIIGKIRRKKKKKFYTKDFFADQPYEIGDHTYGVPNILRWDDKTRLSIGRYCSIAGDVTIILGGNHRSDWVTTYPFNVLSGRFPNAATLTGHPATHGDVRIGNDVWIGQGATILSGVTIGDGAIIGAQAVVAKDVPPYTIVVGNPARPVRKRFDDETIQSLLSIQWWHWDDERVNREVHSLCNTDIERFVSQNTNRHVLTYFAAHPEEATPYRSELTFLAQERGYTVFPYPSEQESSQIVSRLDNECHMPFILHNGKRLYFPSRYSEEDALRQYQNLLLTECLLGSSDQYGKPHQYQSPRVQVETSDILFDIGAAEGLFALDNIEKISHAVILECDPLWFEPLQKTFSPFADKVSLIFKALAANDSHSSLSLTSLLSSYSHKSLFIKIDIEGSEVPSLLAAQSTLANTDNRIKICAASYHRQNDYRQLASFFDEIHYSSETSSGYMLFNFYDAPQPPFFRHGIIRTKNS